MSRTPPRGRSTGGPLPSRSSPLIPHWKRPTTFRFQRFVELVPSSLCKSNADGAGQARDIYSASSAFGDVHRPSNLGSSVGW